MIIARLYPWLHTQHCKVLHSHNIVHTLPPSTWILQWSSELDDLMYSNLAHDKKTLNNEEYVQRIMEAESQGGQVSWILHVRAFYIISYQDDNNNLQVNEEAKSYCWKTEERNGIRYNTLNYANKNRVIRNESEDSNANSSEKDSVDSSKTCCSVIFDNCFTVFLIFIIFMLLIFLIFFIVRCFFLEKTIRELRLFIKNSSKVSENFMISQSSTVESATFFPD